MSEPFSPDVVPPPLSLVSRLAQEMDERWRHGECPTAEEFLDRHPELWQQSDDALRLVYEEVCLRQERGETNVPARVIARFPEWRSELEVLCECHRLLGPDTATLSGFGQMVGGFRIVAELGRGGQGTVYLATDPTLADRPVVLKIAPLTGEEHLNLARLQHTHIVPLLGVREDRAKQTRTLCMPFLGGASLAAVLDELRADPVTKRSGRAVLEALDRLQSSLPIRLPARGKAREWLAEASYEDAICWIGTCLADGLHHAHERGLVHFDLSAGNVLLSAEGVPLLLDFHLARGPLSLSTPGDRWLGGTPGYMAPEQRRAFLALSSGQPLPCDVNHRADVFALGVVLAEALGAPPLGDGSISDALRRHNPKLSIGLADVLARCQARDPEARYPSAEAMAEDLRRHLSGQPLRGVTNRSWSERWRKWRRRQPFALTVVCALLSIGAAGFLVVDNITSRMRDSEAALKQGEEKLALRDYSGAVADLERGRAAASSLPLVGDRTRNFDVLIEKARTGLAAVQREQIADKFHSAVEKVRFVAVAEGLSLEQVRSLEISCRQLWDSRDQLAAVSERLRADLLDLAIVSADLRTRVAPGDEAARRRALAILTEAGERYGTTPALLWERRRHEATPFAGKDDEPATPWEHVLLGRSLLWAGQLDRADKILGRAAELSPSDLWAHFYRGVTLYRKGQHRDAAEEFGVCIALSPSSAAGYYNRALARERLEASDEAILDYSQALKLDPTLAAAAYNRGLLHFRAKHYREALGDFHAALANGADTENVQAAIGRVEKAMKLGER